MLPWQKEFLKKLSGRLTSNLVVSIIIKDRTLSAIDLDYTIDRYEVNDKGIIYLYPSTGGCISLDTSKVIGSIEDDLYRISAPCYEIVVRFM